MIVYFVRHGQTRSNALHIHQGPRGPLSPHGAEQAEAVARRLEKIKIGVIFASGHTRAQQTARIIAKRMGKRVISTGLLNEGKNPTELIGRGHSTKLAVRIHEARSAHITDPNWHYADEENATDFIRRAGRCLDYLSKRREKSILAVSHSGLIHTIVAVMLFGKDLDPLANRAMMHFFELNNTGITVCEYTKSRGWRLITWNDIVHLP